MYGAADRLRALADLAGYESLTEFARAAGVQAGTMRQHVQRNSIPKDAGALYVARAKKTGVTLDWLIHGRGAAPKGIEPSEKPLSRSARLELARDAAIIAEYEVHAMAGQGADGQFEIHESAKTGDALVGQYSFPPTGFRQNFGAEPANVVITEVMGDSMSPTLTPGTKVMVNLRHNTPTPDGIYFLFDGLGLVIKRLQLVVNSNPPRVRIISDNPRYETYERTVEEVQINGRVVVGLTRF